ncbi:MAG: LapA family protein [Nocardioidaceae bacterium]
MTDDTARTGGERPEQPEPVAAPDPQTSTTAPDRANPLRRSRISGAWAALMGFAVVLVLLLIFILQNTQSVQISYLGATGHLPLAVAMLVSALAGVVLTGTAGSLRIWQLRRRLSRSHKEGVRK